MCRWTLADCRSTVEERTYTVTQIRAEGTFNVASFDLVDLKPDVLIPTAMETGIATMKKRYSGAVEGRSSTLFTSSRHAESGAATYVALESFEGSLNGVAGSFNYVHSASTHGQDRYGEFFSIVAASGTKGLAGINGAGGLAVDPNGTHRVWFDYSLD
jgi:hypothetical protein